MSACKKCGSTEIKIVLTPELTHHGKKVCGKCGAYIDWVQKPSGPVPLAETFEQIAASATLPYGLLPGLVGSPKQVGWAESIRRGVLERIRIDHGSIAERAASTITNAGWWIANQDRSGYRIRWPESWESKETEHV